MKYQIIEVHYAVTSLARLWHRNKSGLTHDGNHTAIENYLWKYNIKPEFNWKKIDCRHLNDLDINIDNVYEDTNWYNIHISKPTEYEFKYKYFQIDINNCLS